MRLDSIDDGDLRQPWDRQIKPDGTIEPMLWYGRFKDFCRLPPKRGVATVYGNWRKALGRKPVTRPPSSWYNACNEWGWRSRAEAWDIEEEKQKQLEWESRQEEIRQEDDSAGKELRVLFAEIMGRKGAFINRREKTVYNDDGTETKVVFLALDASLALQALSLASRLQRKASGLEDKSSVTKDIQDSTYSLEQWMARAEARLAQIDPQDDEEPVCD